MKFIKRIISLFTSNWWLKLISLLLAIVIYHAEKSDTTRNQEQTPHDRPIFQIR